MERMHKINWKVLLVWIIAVLFLGVIFFYKLGNSVLMSYDEAWYADIARNMVLTKNPLLLKFNGAPFTDHPPFGYLLMAIPTLMFGSNEFSARVISALLGIGTIVVTYLIGKKLKNGKVGPTAAVVLLSCLWFMFRARSGNLDVPFLFWETLTVLFLLQKGRKFLYFAVISFAALFLTKTLVGVGLLPVIFFLLWSRRKELGKDLWVKMSALFLVLVLPWYVYNQVLNHNFLYHHFIEVGTRSEKNSFALQSLILNIRYFAIGIGKWFSVLAFSVVLALVSCLKEKKVRFEWIVLGAWTAGFSLFFISSKTEIWHLLPLYPIVALAIPLALFNAVELFTPKLKFLPTLIVLACMVLASYQFKQFSNFLYITASSSNEKDISLKAARYDHLYLMETFYPAAVYYSQKTMTPLWWEDNSYQKMTQMLTSQKDAVFLINQTQKKQLEEDKITFKILEQNSSYYLISAQGK